jgi:hypothetical protein
MLVPFHKTALKRNMSSLLSILPSKKSKMSSEGSLEVDWICPHFFSTPGPASILVKGGQKAFGRQKHYFFIFRPKSALKTCFSAMPVGIPHPTYYGPGLWYPIMFTFSVSYQTPFGSALCAILHLFQKEGRLLSFYIVLPVARGSCRERCYCCCCFNLWMSVQRIATCLFNHITCILRHYEYSNYTFEFTFHSWIFITPWNICRHFIFTMFGTALNRKNKTCEKNQLND